MKWYWILLIVIALIAIVAFVTVAIKNGKKVSSSGVKTVINTPAPSTTDKPAATQTTVTTS